MDFLKPEDLRKPRLQWEDVEVPEWGCKVRVWELGADVEQAWESEAEKRTTGNETVKSLVALCAGNEDGPFPPGALDLETLGKQSPIALLRVFRVAKKVNRMTKESVEELLGN